MNIDYFARLGPVRITLQLVTRLVQDWRDNDTKVGCARTQYEHAATEDGNRVQGNTVRS